MTKCYKVKCVKFNSENGFSATIHKIGNIHINSNLFGKIKTGSIISLYIKDHEIKIDRIYDSNIKYKKIIKKISPNKINSLLLDDINSWKMCASYFPHI